MCWNVQTHKGYLCRRKSQGLYIKLCGLVILRKKSYTFEPILIFLLGPVSDRTRAGLGQRWRGLETGHSTFLRLFLTSRVLSRQIAAAERRLQIEPARVGGDVQRFPDDVQPTHEA